MEALGWSHVESVQVYSGSPEWPEAKPSGELKVVSIERQKTLMSIFSGVCFLGIIDKNLTCVVFPVPHCWFQIEATPQELASGDCRCHEWCGHTKTSGQVLAGLVVPGQLMFKEIHDDPLNPLDVGSIVFNVRISS